MKKNRRLAKILSSGALILLTVVSAVSSTFAWFATRRTVSVTADGFQVALPEAQEAKLYYHQANFNESLQKYAGFELARLRKNDYSKFKEYNPESEEKPSPTSTENLWPNHQLSYALVFTPIRTGTFRFSLSSWESDGGDKMIDENTPIRLSYAIHIYSYACEDTDFSKASELFAVKDNKFQDTPENRASQDITILEYDAKDTSTQVILYFSILFSNDSSTYFSKNEENEYYHQNSSSLEQSNCYEGLSFKAKSFTLHAPGGEA